MAIDWDEIRKKANERGAKAESYIKSIQSTPSLPRATPKLPNNTEKVVLKPNNFRNATNQTKISAAQQEKNQALAVEELQGKHGNIASAARGFAGGLIDPYGVRKSWGGNQAQDEASAKNTFGGQVIKNPRMVAQGLKPVETANLKGTFEGLGELGGSLIGVDPLAIGVTNGIQKGVQIAQKQASKIPVLVNGVTKYVDAPVTIPKANVSAPVPRTVASAANAPVEQVIQTAQKAENLPVQRGNIVNRTLAKADVALPDLPVRYNPDMKNEARNFTDHVEVGDKFNALDSEGQKAVMGHENAHNISNDYLFKKGYFQDILNNKAFGESKIAPDGRTYWEGIFGDVGATSVDETLTNTIAVYLRNPEWLKEMHPQAYDYISEKVMKSAPSFKGKPQTLPRASSVTVQPRNPEKGISVPKEQMFSKNADLPSVEQKLKDLGADTNRFEEVAMVTTDSKQTKPSLLEKAAGITSNLKRKFVDAGDTVSKIAKINGDKGLYNLYNNARNASRRAEYHIGEAQTDIYGREIGKSLKDIFDPIRKKGKNYYEDFQEYMYHLHNIDRMGFEEKALQKLREFEINHQELANLTDKELNDMLKTTDNDSAAAIKEYMKLIDDVNNAPSKPVFGKSIDSNESRKVSAYLLQQHPEFAQEAADVRKYLDNLMQYRVQGGLVSEDSAKALSEMYQNYVPTYRVNPSTRGVKTFGNASNISKGIKKATGSSKDLLPLHEQIAKQTMQAVDAAHKNIFGIRLAENINPDTQQFIQELKKVDDAFDIDAEATPELKNTFNVYQNGQAYQMKVDDGLYEGIKALAGSDPNELVKAATSVNKAFKELITSWNPMFLVRNAARDIQDTGLYSKDLSKFAKMYPGAVKEIATNGQMWKQYKALGGAGNSFFDYAKGYKKDPSWIRKNTLDRVEQLNMATEQLPRFAEFLATIEKLGHAPSYDELMQAMYNSADVTVNFGRSGTWGKTLNSTFVPFFNPAMQGTSKLIRRFTETKGVKGWTELVLKASALGVAPSLINEMVYFNDPQYQALNDRDKDINFVIKTGDNEWFKIPKGRVLSLFGAGAQRVYRAAQGDEDAFAGYIKTMGNQVAPISPTESNILSPVMAVKNNKSWYGGAIEPQSLTTKFPSDEYQWKRYDERTSSLAKGLGKAINYSPKKIDYLLDAYSGVIGDFALPLTTPRAEQNPFVKAFTIDSVTSNKIGQQFYDKKDEIISAKNSVDGADKYDTMSQYMNKQNEAVSELYDEIRKVENGVGTDSYKRQKVREIRGIINGIQQTALDTLPELETTTENLSRVYKDPEVLYREVNKKVFGAKYALQVYDKRVYEKATKSQLGFDTYYDAYFAQKDAATNIEKAYAISAKIPNATNKTYEAFGLDPELVAKANDLNNSGITAQGYSDAKTMSDTNGSGDVSKREATEYLNSRNDLTTSQKAAMLQALVPALKPKNNPYL